MALNSSGWRMQWKNTGKQDALVVDLDIMQANMARIRRALQQRIGFWSWK